MPETKTFKNATVVHLDPNVEPGWHIIASEGLGNPWGVFRKEDWDMEVTFTKKVKPSKFKAGDRVNTWEDDEESEYPGTVVGYDEESVCVVWDINPTVVQTFWGEDELYLIA